MSGDPAEPTADLQEEVASGDVRRALVAIRDRLALEMSEDEESQTKACPVKDCHGSISFRATGSQLAAVSKQLTEVLASLDAIKKPEGSKRDELAAARASRRGAPAPDAPDGPDHGSGKGSGRARGKRGAGS